MIQAFALAHGLENKNQRQDKGQMDAALDNIGKLAHPNGVHLEEDQRH